MVYKRPVSVLVVIYARDTGRVLMLQRRDDPEFWQSVTGSIEEGESAPYAAQREVKEEVNIDISAEALSLFDCQRCIEFELFAHLRRRYAPGLRTIPNTGFVWRYLLSARCNYPSILPTSGWMCPTRHS